MGVGDKFDELKDKAKDKLRDNPDQAQEGVDRAADKVDEATGGRHTEQVDRGAQMARDRLDQEGTEP